MSTRYDESEQHSSAIKQIAEAREKALNAVSKSRQFDISTPHRNLIQSSDDTTVPEMCSQRVIDYLIQLRPYRSGSQHWGVDFGKIELPQKMEGDPSKRLGRSGRKPPVYICRQPVIRITNASELIETVNSTVYYSTNRPEEARPDWKPNSNSHTLRTERYGDLEFDDFEQLKAVANGSITPQEAIKTGIATRPSEEEEEAQDRYVPARPWTQHDGGDLRVFKLILPPDRLLKVVEYADEVAAELDMLADIKTPDHHAGERGAV